MRLLITKFDWSVKAKSTHVVGVGRRWSGCDIDECKPWVVDKESILGPS